MDFKKMMLSISFLLLLFVLNSNAKEISNSQKVVMLLEKAFTKNQDRSVLKYVSDKKYIQHNLYAKDQKDGLIAYLDYLSTKDIDTKVVRVFEDQNYVIAQTLSREDNTYMHIIDIFRFENGLIVEHWDNIQTIKNIDLVNGLPIKVLNKNSTKNNKNLIKKYIHDKIIKDNSYIKNHMILAEGEFVLSVSEIKQSNINYALYELFYIDNSKIKKVWKIKEKILEKKNWQNNNSKF